MTENTVLDNNVSSIIKKENCIPKLRFSEFSTVWDLIKLSDVTTSFDYGLAYPSKEYDGENKYIRITDIDEETNSYCKNDIVSPDGKLTKDYLVDENDILFARTGASTGKTYLYNREDGKLYFAGFLIRAHIKETINSKFIFLNTQTFRYKKWVAITSMRSGQPGINSQEYANYKFYLPNRMEQDKIADFIALIDNLILEQLKYISILETYNRGLISKIFKQEIRFKDDNGNEFPDWEEKNLIEVCNFINGKAHENAIEEKGTYIVVNSKFISSDGTVKKYSNAQIVPLYKNDIVMVMSDVPNGKAIAKCYLIDCDNKFTLNQRICALRTNQNPYFIKMQVNRNPYYLKFDDGVKQTNLRKEDVLKCPLQLPCLVEQEKIANFLTSLDNVLQEEKNYLEYLKTIKKGLLQQMFV